MAPNEFKNVEFNGNRNLQNYTMDLDLDKPKIPEDEVVHEYEDVLQRIGFGKTQWIVMLICGLLLMQVINETMGMAILTIASQCDFDMDSVDKAVMSAACFVGILCSSYFWGCFSDTLGRRTVLLYATFSGNLVSFISIFIPNYWVFIFLRFVTGCCIAGPSSTTYAYLSEFFLSRHRPVVVNYATIFVGISFTYVPAVAWGILSYDWSFSFFGAFDFRPWRLIIICNLLPGLIAASVLLTLPESPKLLLSVGKKDEAIAAVNWIYRTNTGNKDKLNVYHIKIEGEMGPNPLLAAKSGAGVLKQMWQETRPLFMPPHVTNFLISCIIMCGFFFSSTGMGLWYPEIQNRVGAVSEGNTMTVCEVVDASMVVLAENTTNLVCDDSVSSKSLMDAITVGLSYVLGYVLLGVVINPLGRKGLIIGSMVISGACGIALHWIMDPTAIIVVFCLFLTLPGLCVSVLSGAVVDLVPTHLRGKAVCLCLMLGRSGSVIGSNIIGVMLESYCSLTFDIFSGFVLICAALTFILPI